MDSCKKSAYFRNSTRNNNIKNKTIEKNDGKNKNKPLQKKNLRKREHAIIKTEYNSNSDNDFEEIIIKKKNGVAANKNTNATATKNNELYQEKVTESKKRLQKNQVEDKSIKSTNRKTRSTEINNKEITLTSNRVVEKITSEAKATENKKEVTPASKIKSKMVEQKVIKKKPIDAKNNVTATKNKEIYQEKVVESKIRLKKLKTHIEDKKELSNSSIRDVEQITTKTTITKSTKNIKTETKTPANKIKSKIVENNSSKKIFNKKQAVSKNKRKNETEDDDEYMIEREYEKNSKKDEMSDSENEDENDWEEVKVTEKEMLVSLVKGSSGRKIKKQKDIKIIIHDKKTNKKLTKPQMFHDAVRCAINRSRSNSQQQLQQIHVLCILTHGRFLSLNVCNDHLLSATLLSLTHVQFLDRDLKSWNSHSILKYTAWFHSTYPCLKNRFIYNYNETQCLINILIQQLHKKQVSSAFEHNLLFVTSLRSMGLKARLMQSFEPLSIRPPDLIPRGNLTANLVEAIFGKSTNDYRCNNKKKEDEEEEEDDQKNKDCKNSDGHLGDKDKNEKKVIDQKKNNIKDDDDYVEDEDEDDDEDYYDGHYYKKNSRKGVGDKNKKVKKMVKKKDGLFSWWAEVYLESENKWIYANSVTDKVGGVKDVQANVATPFSYILAHHPQGYIKDLTSKYDSDWLTETSKKRPAGDWWTVVMMIFKDNQSLIDAVEDVMINDMLKNVPIPDSFAAYKNHPFYALERHLLKYEAFYPLNPPILGHVKGQAVYPRETVKMCHSKDKWMLEGRSIIKGEDAYKVVKGIRRQNDPECLVRWQGLYGYWQTEKYKPPPVLNGKITKNRFGNVEIFQPWMQPPGSVYIKERMLGLGRVAEKMKKDVAPVMLGWHFKKGFNIPIVRGWVVCEGDREVLVSAWWQEQKQILQTLKEKRHKLALKRWRSMTMALLTRERLKKKYNVEF